MQLTYLVCSRMEIIEENRDAATLIGFIYATRASKRKILILFIRALKYFIKMFNPRQEGAKKYLFVI